MSSIIWLSAFVRDKFSKIEEVCVEEQVAIFLYAVSKNASNRTLQDRFQHSGETISRRFNEVLTAIMKLSVSLIQLPPINVPLKVLSNPKFMPYFQVFILWPLILLVKYKYS